MTDRDAPTPSEPEPRVHCPRCGKRFRVDPAGLEGKPDGAPVRCSGCGETFRVRLTEDGDAEVAPTAPAVHRADTTPGKATGAARPKTRRPPGRSSRRGARKPRGETPSTGPRAAGVFGIGERVGRYEIEALLDRGGMGAVYRAFDPAANRHVALKVLSAGAPEEDRHRFRREVEVQGNIQHPHIMPILDSGTLGRSSYFTMELLEDPLSLSALIELSRSGRAAKDPHLRPVSTLHGLMRRVVLPVCQAIYHANCREGVLHRDLKPDNILVDRNGLRSFVIDFGVCSLLERRNRPLAHLLPEMSSRLPGGSIRVTGTLRYMPPEQARGETDRRGDVWGLGAILHHVVTGSAPLAPASRSSLSAAARIEGLGLLAEQARRQGSAREEEEFRRKIAHLEQGKERTLEDLQRDVLAARYLPRPKGQPPSLDAIIAKAMAEVPERRYRHALDLHDDLLAWLERRPVRALLERRGPVRRGLYRMSLFLRRHRRAAILLVVAGLGGAWVAAGLPGSAPGDRNVPPSPALLDEARIAAGAGRLGEARRLAEASLGPGSRTAREAHDFLDGLDALEAAEDLHLERARTLERTALAAFEAGRDADGWTHLAVLAELLRSGLLRPLATGGSPEALSEIERLETAVLGTRLLVVDGGGTDTQIEAVPVEGEAGRIDWERGVSAEEGGQRSLPLRYGAWIVGVRGKGGEVWLPVRVRPGDGAFHVVCPVDPDGLPGSVAYVIGGRARGPLGESVVGPLLWDLTEVTVARYARFLATLPRAEQRRRVPRRMEPGKPDRPLWGAGGDDILVPPADAVRRPVEGVSLHDAQAFARFEGGRLPTAAEWAWAASGPDGRLCPAGPLACLVEGGVRIHVARSADVGTTAVDRSPFGLFDIAGNVAEFTRTRATFGGSDGWLVMGGGYATLLGQALVNGAEAVSDQEPLVGIGFRLVYEVDASSLDDGER